MQSVRAFGIPFGPPLEVPDVANKLPSRQGVSVRLSGLRVAKLGPLRLLLAQAHFCEQLHAQVALRPRSGPLLAVHGPRHYEGGCAPCSAGGATVSVSVGGSGTLPGEEVANRSVEIFLEVIKGRASPPCWRTACSRTTTFAAFERLHSAPVAGAVPTREALVANYLAQLHEHFAAYEVFAALPDAPRVLAEVTQRVEAYAGLQRGCN